MRGASHRCSWINRQRRGTDPPYISRVRLDFLHLPNGPGGSALALVPIAGLTIWGLLLRAWDVGTQSLWVDEATSVAAALGILDHGFPQLASGELYLRAIPHTYLVAAAMFVAGAEEWVVRLPSVLFGAASIPLAFVLVRRFVGYPGALTVAALIAFIDIEIAWSRQARMYQQLQFLTLATVVSYFRYLMVPSRARAAVLFLLMLFSVATHFLALITVAAALMHFGAVRVLALASGKDLSRHLREIAAGVSATLILILLFEEVTGQLISVFSRREQWLPGYLDYYRQLMPVAYFGSIVGYILALRSSRSAQISFIVLLLVVAFYVVGFHGRLVAYRYTYFLVPFLFLGPFVGITALWEGFRLPRHSVVIPWLALLILAFWTSPFSLVPHAFYYLDSTSPQPDYKSAYRYVEERWAEGDVLMDTWPTLAQFYLGRSPEYWPAISLDGRSPPTCRLANGDREAYGYALCVDEATEVTSIIAASSGWLITDDLGWQRLNPGFRGVVETSAERHHVPSQGDPAILMHVFRW